MSAIKTLYSNLMLKQEAFKALEKTYLASKSEISELKEEMLGELNEIGTESYKGELGSLSVRTSVLPAVEDWDSLYSFIHTHNAFDLLQRRVSATAFRDRLDEGEDITGVTTMKRKTLYIKLS